MTACLFTGLQVLISLEVFFNNRFWLIIIIDYTIACMLPILHEKETKILLPRSFRSAPAIGSCQGKGGHFPRPCQALPFRPTPTHPAQNHVGRAPWPWPWPWPYRGAERDTAFLGLRRAAAARAPGGGREHEGGEGRGGPAHRPAPPPIAPAPSPLLRGAPTCPARLLQRSGGSFCLRRPGR